ncbi:fatty acid CoA ligase family protein [Microbispora amethystogenes]|uniref:Peptide synthase n=1 Tax=Microbispora amethystogenes TaxID=1427754 RepID=A0ABQ4FDM9_9ACTN|nr:fatty acid CoA ligase family protein [Microbispora amethystogenes]GIH32930.1 peptide synthase [Microbispora amethystogenes]
MTTEVTPPSGSGPAEPVSELIVRAERWFREQPDVIACQVGGRRPAATTYGQLSRSVDHAVAVLMEAGIRPGMRTALLVPPGPELGAFAVALIRLRAVPVLVDPGLPLGAIRRCLRQAAPEAFVAIPAVQLARRLLRWTPDVRVSVTVPARLPREAESGVDLWRHAGPDDLALIAYTSGSTGPPKGVPLRHRHLAAQLTLLGELGTVEPGLPVLSTFAPFALGAAAFGATVVIPDMDPRHPVRADPAALVADIRRYRVSGMFAPPALLDRLARHCAARDLVLDTLGDVVSAGAPLPMPVMDRLRGCLRDDARVLSVYGATECMPVAAIESRLLAGHAAATAAGAGTCLGLPLPGAEVRVIALGDDPVERWSDDLVVPPGAIGEIVVAAPTVSDPYLDDPEATALARIRDGDRVWHRMGDVGRFDEQGRLWFAGRRSERVRTVGGDLHTDQVEPVFAAVPGVRRTALVGVGYAGAQRPVLVVEREPGVRDDARVTAGILSVAARHPHTEGIRDVLFHRGFPVDARHNSKIRRHELARWAARRVRAGR